MATLAVLTCALVGVVAVARSRSTSEEGPARGEADENRSVYSDQVHAQLEEWESQLESFRREEREFESIENYMLADDLELLMKDVRGDLAKLQTSRTDTWEKIRNEIESKLSDLRRSVTQIFAPIGATARNAVTRD
jgi:hypothetical protein